VALPSFLSWQGTIGRAHYAIIGTLLFALKHNIDRVIATAYGHEWSVFNYWAFDRSLRGLTEYEAGFYALLLLAALPFIWIGVVLTVRRLRDAGLPVRLVFVFFLPFINLFFFILLSIVPSADNTRFPNRTFHRLFMRVVPDSEVGSAALGVLTTVVFAVAVTAFSINRLGNYGWGLFVGLPFFLGLNSVLIYGIHRPRSLGRCLGVAVLSIIFVGGILLALAVEGFICLAMALPLASVIALFGGFIGFILQQRDTDTGQQFRVVSLVFLIAPAFVLFETWIGQRSPLYEVKTSVVINAKPEVVWQHLLAFTELPPPQEAIFKTGIAYPTRARIEGTGVGAVRHCVFSTGPFVEPITVWDAPRKLAFDVSAQPAVMEEFSPYGNLRPPHVNNYLTSRRGQFVLTELPTGQTLLEGTTWYENRFWPGPYWRLWSDYIIHRIHERVLVHIKKTSEEAVN
jgi:uncharacterized membrane protein YhaH (DUF805 family)